MDKNISKTLKIFWALWSDQNFFSKIGICHFSYFMMYNFMEKNQKKLIYFIADKWKDEPSQIY